MKNRNSKSNKKTVQGLRTRIYQSAINNMFSLKKQIIISQKILNEETPYYNQKTF